MIGEKLCDLFFGVFRVLFSVLENVKLPFDMLGTFETFFAYGVWIIGADLLIYFTGAVIFWWSVQMSIGLAVWVWEKLPLT